MSMKRYYFHIRDEGGTVLDEEGEEHRSLEEARQSAVDAIKELAAARKAADKLAAQQQETDGPGEEDRT